MPPRLQALFAMSPEHLPMLFPGPILSRLSGLVDIDPNLVGTSFTEDARAAALAGRLSAILDVTDPEPLPGDSILYELPNVFLTPHISGSQGNESVRMGLTAVDEVDRLTGGRDFAFGVDLGALATTA